MGENFIFSSFALSTICRSNHPHFFQSKLFRSLLKYTGSLSRYIILLIILMLSSIIIKAQSPTYDFTTNATLSFGTAGFGIWNTQADITIGGVAYRLTSGGNGSFTNAGSGGAGNSKCLRKDGSGGDQFILQRADGQPFQFYGIWVKHESMNSYAQFMQLPPFYSVTYHKTVGGTETDVDNTAMQAGSLTSSERTFTKNLTVTSVSISFNAIMYYWIDNIIVGPVVSLEPSITSHPVNRTVCALSNTSFSITATNATSYQWQVNTGAGFGNISNNTTYSGATTHTLSVAGATSAMNGYLYRCIVNGSLNSNNASLTVNSVSLNAQSQTNIACNGGATGAASVSPATGGTGPYTYNWTPGNPAGDGTTSVTGLAAGVWTCTVTDANNCTASQSFTIVQPAALTATTSQSNVSCNGGSNGVASVTASGGAGSYSYSWSPSGGTAATATGLAAGTYTVTITDANACSITRNFTITQPAAFTATTSQSNVSCNGGSNGVASVTASGGTGPYSYSWSPSGGTAATATGLAAGTYTVTITDANACSITRNFTITQPAAFTAVTSQSNVSCNGISNGVASVTASGGTGPYTYSWSPSGGTAATATGLAAGTYTVTITDANACSITRNFTITQPSSITLNTSKTDVSCNEGSNGVAAVTASGGAGSYSYSWSPSGGTAATATGLAAGVYTVTVTDANGCQRTAMVTVTQPARLTATASFQTICSGETSNIILTSNLTETTFTWTSSVISGNVSGAGSGSGSSIAQTLTGSGVVQYSITPARDGCTGDATTATVTVNALTAITGNPSDIEIDEHENAVFSVSASNGSTYQWQVDQGSGFANLTNGESYEGTTGATLTVYNAPESMDGFTYRCIVTGNCAPVTSEAATLSVRVRTPQTISFAALESVIYGAADITPGGSSDAGLTLTYSSSDESIASVINGKIRIHKAGQVTITATQAGNYEYKPATPVTQTLQILPKEINLSLSNTTPVTKVYDGNSTATLAAANYILEGIEAGDMVSVTGQAAYNNADAGINKAITATGFVLSGADKDNYTLQTLSAETSGSITRKEVSVALNVSPAISKTYNGTAGASLAAANYTLHGIVGEDELTVSGTAVYADKNAGPDKQITVTSFVLDGAGKDNYTVVTASAQTTGTIQKKDITLTLSDDPAISKTYDGGVAATLQRDNYLLTGVEADDGLSVSGTALYEDRNVASTKNVAVSGFVLDGTDKDNYDLTTTALTTTGSITAKVITITLQDQSPVSKEYDGNTDAVLIPANYLLNDVVGEDEVVLNNPASGVYENKNGGGHKNVTVSGLTISGADADNYVLGSSTVTGAIGTITPKPIVVTADAQTKVYGSEDPVFTYTAEGKLPEDVLSGSLQKSEGNDVGTYDILQGTLSGGSNYTIEAFHRAAITITPAALLIRAEDKTKKQGADNPVFTYRYEGLAEGDQPSDLDKLPSAVTSAGKNTPIGDYDITVSGAASENYEISYENGKLSVTPQGNENYSVKVWSSSPDVLQIRVFTTTAQKAAIILYSEVGQQVILQQRQLAVGNNSFSVQVGHLASSTYILNVSAEKFKDAQKVKVK